MFRVSDVEADVKRVLGACSDEDFYSRLNHAVEILSTEAEWDPLVGYMDVCTDGCGHVVLPRDVGTPLAVSINGEPAQGHDFWFQFHLNGPGAGSSPIGWHWSDQEPVASFRQPNSYGSYLSAALENPADAGKSFRVFGYTPSGNWIRTIEGSGWVDGFLVPLTTTAGTTNPNAPKIGRISAVQKDATLGVVKLYRIEATGVRTRIGQYYPDETDPQYRRIQVTPGCSWARVAFRKGEVKLARPTDLIPLHSKYAVVLMAKALKKFDEDRLEEGEVYQRKAVDLLRKKQESVEIPAGPSIQMANNNLIANKADRLD